MGFHNRRQKHRSANRRRIGSEDRRRAASLLREYRKMFRRAGYRVIGQRILQTGLPDARAAVGIYDGAQIAGVSLRQEGAPRLILSWRQSGPSGVVRIPVLTAESRQ